MILLVSGATKTVEKLSWHPNLGRFIQPRSGNSIMELASSGLPWAADNDCFQGLDPDEYIGMINRIALHADENLKFVTVPDVVANCEGTLALFNAWYPALAKRALPAAFVAQDGLTIDRAPWDRMAALFIGGSTRWKLSGQAIALIRYAQKLGIWVHVGRVNTRQRLTTCAALGVNSSDGTQFSRWPETHLPWALELLRHEQKLLL